MTEHLNNVWTIEVEVDSRGNPFLVAVYENNGVRAVIDVAVLSQRSCKAAVDVMNREVLLQTEAAG